MQLPKDTDKDTEWMTCALRAAEEAAASGEVPVGAVVVVREEIVARAHNRRESDRDPTAHAELIAIREAGLALGRWRLDGATVYTTLEPCPMCAGAIIAARVDRVVFGARDPKAGACGSVVDLFIPGQFNHHPAVVGGVMAEACGVALRAFFEERRTNTKGLSFLGPERGLLVAKHKQNPRDATQARFGEMAESG